MEPSFISSNYWQKIENGSVKNHWHCIRIKPRALNFDQTFYVNTPSEIHPALPYSKIYHLDI